MHALRRVLFLRHLAPKYTVTRVHIRPTHSTPVVLKKKDKQGAPSFQEFGEDVQDDVPAEEFVEEELFGSTAAPSAKFPNATVSASPARAEAFESLLESTLPHLATPRKGNPPRRSVVQRLCMAADMKEQLEKVLDVIAMMRNVPMPISSNDFFRRCIKLDCPELILQALRNRPKYKMDLTLAEARIILNAFARQKKDIGDVVANTLAFAELYPWYGFPPASKDLISSVILAEVIARRVPKKSVDAQLENDDNGIVRDSFRTILGEMRTASASWGSGSVAAAREARWLRRSMDIVLPVARRTKEVQPWLRDLNQTISTL